MANWGEMTSFIFSVADQLRGPYRPNQYKDVMLPMTVLRRLDCVLEPTKDNVLAKYESLKNSKVKNIEPILSKQAGQTFYNTSRFTFKKLRDDPENIAANLKNYIKGFSSKAREIIDYFGFEDQITRLDKANRLYLLVSKFCEIDLHPDKVSNIEMGYVFEELIRKFNEASNEEAGDHFTPREVIRLMVNLIFAPDNDVLTTKGIIKTLYDPACGTGGMLSVSENYLRELNPDADLEMFGEDYNEQAYAICGSDMMIKGESLDNIRFGDSFTEDHFASNTFDYMLANPPFGVKWEAEYDYVKKEFDELGDKGRFGAGLPRIDDGSLLFIQHMISKMKSPERGGSRLAIVFNASPLFSGGAGSGESNIRRWIIENDWLEGIIALPPDLFYNTGITTYIWVVTNRKEKIRKGKIQLVDATGFFTRMRRNLGSKRNEISLEQIDEITKLYAEFEEREHVKIFENLDLGYKHTTVERPLRVNFAVTDARISRVREIAPFKALASTKKRKNVLKAKEETAEGERLQNSIIENLEKLRPLGVVKNRRQFSLALEAGFRSAGLIIPNALLKAILVALSEPDDTADACTDGQGNFEPDREKRDYEKVPLREDIRSYMVREVLPYVSDAWVDESKTKVGYEINFNRYFYKYSPVRPLDRIEADLEQIEREIAEKLVDVG
jgi:type I restriction enzyme M protein